MGIDFSKQAGRKFTTKGTHKICVDIESIIYIQRCGGLSTIFLKDNKEMSDIKTLKAFEEEFAGMGFIRISRNTLINGRYIHKVTTNAGKKNVTLGNIVLPVARRRVGKLNKHLYFCPINN